MQIVLTTPMFNFVEDTKPVLTKNGVPLWVYCGFTVTGFVVLLITNSYLNESGIFSSKKPEARGRIDEAASTHHERSLSVQNHVQPGKQEILGTGSDKHSISKESIPHQSPGHDLEGQYLDA